MDLLTVPLPLSRYSHDALRALPQAFLSTLTAAECLIAIEAFLCLDFASNGKLAPRELQIRSAIAVRQGKDLIVRSGTGSGKTLAMILPVFMLRKDAVVITVSPLRLIQDHHIAEFTKYGIPSIAINSHTPNDPALWKSIKKHSTFRHYSVSPEQCGEYKGHIPKFAHLLHDPKWAKRIRLLQIDEAHFIVTAGQGRGGEGAFRSSFSNLWERLRVHLPSKTPCAAFSASLPDQYINIVMKTLRMDPDNTTQVLLTTNRPNLIYATIPMNGTIKNLSNLDFLAPQPFPAQYQLLPCIVFIDNKTQAARIEKYLNSRLPADLAACRPFRKHHSGMSREYLEQTIALFKAKEISGLIATECASNGFDMATIRLIVVYGVPKDVPEQDQRAGRGGRDGSECLVLTIAESWAYNNLAETDPDHTPGKKEKRTTKAMISYASTKDCRRKFLAAQNNDTTPSALSFSGGVCCDNDTPNFDLSSYLPGLALVDISDSESLPRKPRRRYRPVRDRAPLEQSLHFWTKTTHDSDAILKSLPRSWILSDDSINLLARQKPHAFQTPREITVFLEEDDEWHSRYALDVLTVICMHDLKQKHSTCSSSESDNESNEGNNSDSDSAFMDETVQALSHSPEMPPRDSPTSSAATSRSNSPSLPETPPPPAVSSTGRPLRKAAANHSVSAIAQGMVKRARLK